MPQPHRGQPIDLDTILSPVLRREWQNEGRQELLCESDFIVLPPSFCHSCFGERAANLGRWNG